MRPLLGDLLRSWRAYLGRPARFAGSRGRSLYRNLESGVHAVRAACRRQASRFAAAVDRYRHGARAHGGGAAGHLRQLQDRSVRRVDRSCRRFYRRRSGRRAKGLAPRHCRPSARVGVSDCGWRAAVERRSRLCAPPHHAPRHAPRRTARRQRAAAVEARACSRARDGAGLSGAHSRAGAGHRDAQAGRDALPPHAGARPRDPR